MKKLFLVLVISLFWGNICSANSLKIVDGDTIVLNGKKIRFEGIDTPELKQTCLKDNEKVKCGMLAKKLLIKKIGNNVPACIGKKKDFYKRTLAECFINGESLSSFMVKNGYACDYIYYSKGKYAKEQKYAKASKLGVWKMKYNTSWENKCRKK